MSELSNKTKMVWWRKKALYIITDFEGKGKEPENANENFDLILSGLFFYSFIWKNMELSGGDEVFGQFRSTFSLTFELFVTIIKPNRICFGIFGYCNLKNNGIYSPDDHDRSMASPLYEPLMTHLLTFPLFSSIGILHASYCKVIVIDSYVRWF